MSETRRIPSTSHLPPIDETSSMFDFINALYFLMHLIDVAFVKAYLSAIELLCIGVPVGEPLGTAAGEVEGEDVGEFDVQHRSTCTCIKIHVYIAAIKNHKTDFSE